jgi:hypothetical protein
VSALRARCELASNYLINRHDTLGPMDTHHDEERD